MSTTSPSSEAVGSLETASASGLEGVAAESFDQEAPRYRIEIDPIRYAVWSSFLVLVVTAWLAVVIWGLGTVT